jgi:hypothetical protein
MEGRTQMFIEAKPAYGRDYKSQAEVKADWNADLDFQSYTGQYLNKSDAKRLGYKVLVRYARELKVVQVN